MLYINSGGMPEYCNEFGLEVTLDNFEGLIIDSIFFINLRRKWGHTLITQN